MDNAHSVGEPHKDSSLLHLPGDVSAAAFSSLDKESKKALRRVCTLLRAVVNGGVKSVRLNGEHLRYLGANPGALTASNFPSMTSLTLFDDSSRSVTDLEEWASIWPEDEDFLPEMLCMSEDGCVTDDLLEVWVCSPPPSPSSHLPSRCASPLPGSPRPQSPSSPARTGPDGAAGLLARIRSLDLKACAYLSPRGTHHLLRSTPRLQELVATRWCGAAALMDLPTCCPQLTTLVLGDAQVDVLPVNDEALQVVAACSSLTSLSLQRCVSITDCGLASLAALPRLAHLNITHTHVAGSQLSRLTSLQALDATGCLGLGDAALQAAAGQLPRLQQLTLAGTSVTNTGLGALQQAPGLRSVLLGANFELADEGLAALAACPQLALLSVGNFNLTRPAPQGGFPALTQLQFGGSFFNRGVRHAFPLGPALTHVVATGYDTVTDTHLACVARQRTLTHVELHGGYQLSCAGLQLLQQLPRLAQLTVVSCPLLTPESAHRLLAATPSLQRVLLRKAAWEPNHEGQCITAARSRRSTCSACGRHGGSCCREEEGCGHAHGAAGGQASGAESLARRSMGLAEEVAPTPAVPLCAAEA